MKEPHYIIRETSSLQDLKPLLKLRYRLLRSGWLGTLIPENPYGIALDAWDLRSRHYGLYRIDQGHYEPVGYMRIVEEDVKPKCALTSELVDFVDTIPEMKSQVLEESMYSFPTMEFWPLSETFQAYHTSVKNRGEKLIEVMPFLLDPSVRFLSLVKHMVESVFAVLTISQSEARVVIHAAPGHREFFHEYGFRQLADYQPEADDPYFPFYLMSGSANRLPFSIQTRIADMAEALRHTGTICYYPYAPDKFVQPLEEVFGTVTEEIAVAYRDTKEIKHKLPGVKPVRLSPG